MLPSKGLASPPQQNLNLPFVLKFSPGSQSQRTVLDRFCLNGARLLKDFARLLFGRIRWIVCSKKRGKGLRNKAKQRGALGMFNLFFLEPKRLARIQFLTDTKRHFGQVTF